MSDTNLIYAYPLEQAIADGVLTEILSYDEKPVVVTSPVRGDFNLSVLLSVFHDYLWWKANVEPTLPEEKRLFKTERRTKTLWLIEDDAAYTIMYPEDY